MLLCSMKKITAVWLLAIVLAALLAEETLAQKSRSEKRKKTQPVLVPVAPRIPVNTADNSKLPSRTAKRTAKSSTDDQKLSNRTPINPRDKTAAQNLPRFEMRRMKGTTLLQKESQVKIPSRLRREQKLAIAQSNDRRKTEQLFSHEPIRRPARNIEKIIQNQDFSSTPVLRLGTNKADIYRKEAYWNHQANATKHGIKFTNRQLRSHYYADLKQFNYQGNIVKKRGHSPYAKSDALIAAEQGNIRIKKNKFADSDALISEATGNIKITKSPYAASEQKSLGYMGHLTFTNQQLRSHYRSDYRQANYHGDLIRRKHHNHDRVRADVAANFRLDYSVKISKKNLHPSAAYLSSLTAGSFAAKEFLRMQAIKRAKRQANRKKGKPIYLRKKLRDLEYDKNEIKIWTTR